VRFAYVALVVLVILGVGTWLYLEWPLARPEAAYVGSDACADCHASEHAAWHGSQHAVAMCAAADSTVLGDFDGAHFREGATTAEFFRREGRFYVRTEGADGRPAEFEIRYTFGVHPLQQYLVSFPGGRLQALGIAWDARPAAAGGQRWFALEPDTRPGDAVHWTGIDQNWNYQCADCHSTNLRKGFDAERDSFATTWSEINVGCESCHGPASNHLTWAAHRQGWRKFDGPGKGLPARLDERRDVAWTIDPATGNAVRSKPRESERELEVCARCHSRRSQFADAAAGEPLLDAFRPALIESGLYHADGQQRAEVYNHGSFLQSRMNAKGVTCSDCHDPHTQRLRSEGDGVCAPCHAPAKYQTAEHHHHAEESVGARCVSCHMPPTTYMQIDPRLDHSIRIPRPDRTVTLGTPNACNGCHTDRSPDWAAAQVRTWFPAAKPGFQAFAEAFHAADQGAPGASAGLLAVTANRELPAFVRASALARMSATSGPRVVAAAGAGLQDPDATVRAAAVQVLAEADETTRSRHLTASLDDPVRLVRMEAAHALAGRPERRMVELEKNQFEDALQEFVQSERFNAERPESHMNLAGLQRQRGQLDRAEASLVRALQIDPTFEPAAVNLASLLSERGREAEAERVLREFVARQPRAASAQHALGLSLIRQKRAAEALPLLAEAVRLMPENSRFAYVYAVGLHDTGMTEQARCVLESAVARDPYDRDLLNALAAYDRAAGRVEDAQRWARRLSELEAADR
jgi:tetratricopeptide (TPR) repeat protein